MPFDFAQDAGVDHRRLHILVTGHFLHGADTEPETAEELVRMQTLPTLWQKAWTETSQNPQQRLLLSVQAKDRSDKAVDFSGLA